MEKGFALQIAVIFLSFIASIGQARIQVERHGKTCKQDFKFPNGFTTFIENGAVVLFECRSGFVPYGAMKSTCVKGTWDAEPPTCIKKGCSQLRIPIHGRVEEEFSGALVRYQCDTGFKLEGSAVLTCDGRQWSSSPPTCSALPRQVVKNISSNKMDL